MHALAGQELDAEERVLGRARMDGGGRSVVPRVERLERVEGFLWQTDLADHEPIGAHPERVRDQIAYVEKPVLGIPRGDVVRMERLEVEAIAVVEVKLGRVLDDADTLGRIEEVG